MLIRKLIFKVSCYKKKKSTKITTPCPNEISIEMQIFRQVFHDGSDDFPMASNHCRRFLASAALGWTVISLRDKLVQLAETYGASQMIFNYFGTCTYPRVSPPVISLFNQRQFTCQYERHIRGVKMFYNNFNLINFTVTFYYLFFFSLASSLLQLDCQNN